MVNVQAGSILVAPPQIADPRFQNSVVLVAHASPDGHWGLCLNKNMKTSTRDLFPSLGIDLDLDVDIYWGGPVSQGIIWMLHDASWSMDTTMIIDDHWAMTSHKDMFHELAVQGTPDEWRLFSGFSVWGPGQLEGELEGQAPWTAKSSWLHCQGLTPTWSFGYDQDHDLWAAAISLSSQQAVREWIA